MTILERLKDAEVEIKALLQDLEEERKKNATLQQQLTNVQKVSNSEYWSLRDEIHKLREKRKEQTAENEALRRDLIVSRTETKNLQELYEEQVRYTASMCKRLQSGKDWFVVTRGTGLMPFAFDDRDSARNYSNAIRSPSPIHVREVVNVDTGTIDMGTGMGDFEVRVAKAPNAPDFVAVDKTVLEPKTGGAVRFSAGDKAHIELPSGSADFDPSCGSDFTVSGWFIPNGWYPRITDLGEHWFSVDAIQIIEYDWRYAGWTDGKRRYGPICCTGPLTTFDTVVIRDEWGNDLLTWEGMQKHCNEIEKRLDDAMKLLRETCGEHYGVFDWYGFRLRAKALVEKYGEGGDDESD